MDFGLCVCGSGLRRVRCCDAGENAIPDPANVSLLDGQAQEATKLFNEKKYIEAEALALKLLDLAPNQRQALRVLYEIRKAQNRPQATEVLARRLADLPGTPAVRSAANSQLAQYLIGLGRHAEARAPAEAAVMAMPKDATAQHVMGVVLTETGYLAEGEQHYRKALMALGREDGLVIANTAWNLKMQGRLEDAAKLYERALAIRGDNKRGVGGYAQVEFARGNTEKAIALLEDGLKRWPNDRTLRLLRVYADLYSGRPEAVLERLNDPVETLLAPELCARGLAFARLQRPAEAVGTYAAAKKLLRERSGQSYQPEPFQARFETYKSYFTAERIQPLPRARAAAGPQPVFLLGFPRSGSSLLEQLLAQLPGFAAGDESADIGRLTASIAPMSGEHAADYPQVLDRLLLGSAGDVPDLLRERYKLTARRLGLARPGISFVTDRNPANFWHLGLIKLLFPEAPVIHVLRHPLDVVLSNLSQEKKLEANAQVSMAAAARHYALTMNMIKHFRGQLTLRYLPLRYEELVQNPAETLRRLLEFLGADAAILPPENALLANAARPEAAVPGHFVAREPVHQRGVYRFRDYQQIMPNLFADVREVLNPWIEELGYAEAAA